MLTVYAPSGEVAPVDRVIVDAYVNREVGDLYTARGAEKIVDLLTATAAAVALGSSSTINTHDGGGAHPALSVQIVFTHEPIDPRDALVAIRQRILGPHDGLVADVADVLRRAGA